MRCMVLLFGLVGCADPASSLWKVPRGATAYDYEPATRLTTFPDDYHTVADASPTGLRVQLAPSARAELQQRMPEGFNLVDALEQLDGFGTLAAVTLRFTGRVDPAFFFDAAHFVRLDDGAPVAFEVEWTDQGSTALLFPQVPLEPGTRYGVAITDTLTDTIGNSVVPSVTMWSLLRGTPRDAALARMVGSHATLVEVAGLKAEEVVAATVFTTQTIQEDEQGVAETLASTPASSWVPLLPCTDQGVERRCEGELQVLDFLGEDEVFDPADPATPYVLPTNLYLPQGEGPWPVVIYGHGLGGDRYEAGRLAEDLAEIGFATASIDAPAHGDHPTARDEEDLFKLLRFFGVDITNAGFDVLQSRDHWRQAMWDKQQLARALRRDTDVDGDGTADLDGRTFYSGHSLGGTMGPALLAVDPQIEAAELSVPGGRVSDIIRKSDTFAILVMALTPPGTDPGEVERFFPLLQTVLERGDPANRAAATLDRDVLMTMVIDDDIMPNSTTSALARAMRVEHGGPILQPVTGLGPVDLPTAGNVDGHTRVLYQYDQQWDDDTDALEPADHEHAQSNLLSVTQLQHWWITRLQTGQAQAIDPLDALGL